MNKAVTGTFADSAAASRGINDLKAHGFGGENIAHSLREDALRDTRLPGPAVMPGMEPLKGIVIGAIVGAILGAAADRLLGMALSWASLGFNRPLISAVVTMAVVGGVAGLIEGLAAMGPLFRARRTLASRRRGDALVSVHTDEMHAGEAIDILRAAGAWDVRRGATSLPDEFRTVETVQPEPYVSRPLEREPVGLPAQGEREAESSGSGGALG